MVELDTQSTVLRQLHTIILVVTLTKWVLSLFIAFKCYVPTQVHVPFQHRLITIASFGFHFYQGTFTRWRALLVLHYSDFQLLKARLSAIAD